MAKRVLIVFASTEGQTRKIAQHISQSLAAGGVTALLADAEESGAPPALDGFDGVLVAASLHAGGFQKSARTYMRRHQAELAALPNAFISVSLSAAGDDAGDWAGLEKCLEEMAAETGWRPAHIEHVAGAFRYTHYDFFKRLAMKHIAARRGAPVDVSRDWELTDWPKLTAFTESFAAALPA